MPRRSVLIRKPQSALSHAVASILGVSSTVTSSALFVQGSDHGFTGLPLDSDGWHDLNAIINGLDSGSRIVYLSDTGNDTTAASAGDYSPGDSSTPTNPGSVSAYLTYSAAYARLRDGFSDVLLIEYGTDYTGEIDEYISKSGASASAPLIIAAYGDPADGRPETVKLFPSDTADYTIISDLKMTVAGADYRGNYNLVENCEIYNTVTSAGVGMVHIVFYAKYSVARRCIFGYVQCYSGHVGGPAEQGGANGFNFGLLEENYHFSGGAGSFPTSSSHNVYLNDRVWEPTSRWSTSVGSPGTAYRQRGLGEMTGVLALGPHGTGVELDYGFGGSPVYSPHAVFRQNMNLDSNGTTSVVWANVNTTFAFDFSDNIIEGGTFGIQAEASGYGAGAGTIEDNIFWNGGYPTVFNSDEDVEGPIVVQNNDFQRSGTGAIIGNIGPNTTGYSFGTGNRYWSETSNHDSWFGGGTEADYVTSTGTSTQVSYTDPGRTIVDYMTSLGESPSDTADAISMFQTGALAQRRGNWVAAYTGPAVINYRREGFDKDPIVIDYTVAPIWA